MSRGDRREDIFVADVDRLDLLVKRIAERLHLGKPKGARTNLHKFMNPRTDIPQIQREI